MGKIKPANILYIANADMKQARLVQPNVAEDCEESPIVSAVRPGGKQGDANHMLDQALLFYRQGGAKKASPSSDVTDILILRRKAAHKEKKERLQKRRLDYERVRKVKAHKRKEDWKRGAQQSVITFKRTLRRQTLWQLAWSYRPSNVSNLAHSLICMQ